MPRIVAIVVAVALALSGAVGTPARAEPGPSTSASDGVLWPDCRTYPYSYDFKLPAWAQDWTAQVVLTGPDGLSVDSDFLSDTDSATGVGTSTLLLCGGTPGAYSITATGTFYAANYQQKTDFVAPASTFHLRLPRTRTGLVIKPTKAKCGQIVRATVTVKDERPNGYFATPYATAKLQVLRPSGWYAVQQGRISTDSRGRGTLRLRFDPCRAVKLRAEVSATDDYSSSVSRAVRLHR